MVRAPRRSATQSGGVFPANLSDEQKAQMHQLNELMTGLMVLRHQFAHHLNGTFKVEAFSRTHAQLKCYFIQFLLAVHR